MSGRKGQGKDIRRLVGGGRGYQKAGREGRRVADRGRERISEDW